MGQPVESPPGQSMAERYRRPAVANRRRGLVVVAVAAVLLLGWAVWAALGQTGDGLGAQVEAYQVTSSHAVTVTVQVTRSSGDPVHCTVSAVASDHSAVGQSVVEVPSGESGTTTVTVVVKTERRATSVDVGRCR